MERRVVITGMDTINPLGDTLEGYYQALLAGKSGVRVWKSIDLSKVENKVGGDLGGYDWAAALERLKDVLGDDFKPVRKLFKFATFSSRLSMLTAMNAWKQAGLFAQGARDAKVSKICIQHIRRQNFVKRKLANLQSFFLNA